MQLPVNTMNIKQSPFKDESQRIDKFTEETDECEGQFPSSNENFSEEYRMQEASESVTCHKTTNREKRTLLITNSRPLIMPTGNACLHLGDFTSDEAVRINKMRGNHNGAQREDDVAVLNEDMSDKTLAKSREEDDISYTQPQDPGILDNGTVMGKSNYETESHLHKEGMHSTVTLVATMSGSCLEVDEDTYAGCLHLPNFKKRHFLLKDGVECKTFSAVCWLSFIVVIMVSCIPVAALPQVSDDYVDSLCIPTISDGTPEENTFRQIECEISKCKKISKIRYEKTNVWSPTTWTPVFEGINKTVYYSIKTENDYTLDKRADYTAFHTKHLLYIRPLTLEDQGKWRCVVYENNDTKCSSQPIVINKHVTPNEGTISINPRNTTLVNGQIAKFMCATEGINPEPNVEWKVNGVQYGKGTADNNRRPDKLWSVINTINIGFDIVGVNVVECSMKTRTRDPWLHNHISIDIKESATVLEPTEEMNIATNANFTFHLLCSGSGYRPKITWTKNERKIHPSDPRYIIKQNCSSEKCTGSITPTIMYTASGCSLIDEYTGIYKCIISLEPPYNSKQVSANMNVYIPQKLCDNRYTILIIGLAISITACVTSTVIAVVVVICRWNDRKQQKQNTIQELQLLRT